ncbi:hypothetical protein PTKIN_Ptkin14bG0074700 [Pterospermum kingtungense]
MSVPHDPSLGGGETTSAGQPPADHRKLQRKQSAKQKYGFIPDNYSTLDQVTKALRESGLESSNLILGIDFTKSNEWTGKVSFNNRSLHAISDNTQNPYEKAISVIGKTLAPFDEDNLIPCFGFGDATTHDTEVFSFHNDHSPCHGFEEVLACYRKIVPNLRLAGPTSYGPVIDAAVDIVENSGGQFHVLVIVADGQVTRSVNTSDRELSPQEEKTINSIVNASLYPLSIVLVGVGDGPWEDMKKFDDKIPSRDFDNFQKRKKLLSLLLHSWRSLYSTKQSWSLVFLDNELGRRRKWFHVLLQCPTPTVDLHSQSVYQAMSNHHLHWTIVPRHAQSALQMERTWPSVVGI